jgi:hypothetical protein
MNKNSILLLSFASNLTWLAFNGLCKSLEKYFQFFKSLSSILQMVKSQNTIDANAIWPYWCRPDCAAISISGPANSYFLVVIARHQKYGKWNVHKQKAKVKVYTNIFIIRH